MGIKGFFFKSATILKWFFWMLCVGFFSYADKLYFVVPFILAVACGLLIKKHIRRIPVFLIPAVCVLLGGMFQLLIKANLIPGALLLLITDIIIPAILLFWFLRKPTALRSIWFSAYLLFAFLLDSRLLDAFDPTRHVNAVAFDQMLVKLFAWWFLAAGMRKMRKTELCPAIKHPSLEDYCYGRKNKRPDL